MNSGEKKRNDPEDSLVDSIIAGVAMCLFKKGSRKAMNDERKEPTFRKQYERLFTCQLPHMDTGNIVMKEVKEFGVEQLKAEVVKGGLTNKVLRRYRLFGQYSEVVNDGTYVMDLPEGHGPHC